MPYRNIERMLRGTHVPVPPGDMRRLDLVVPGLGFAAQLVIDTAEDFVLLEELERTEKGLTDMSVSYGLVMSDDITLSEWQCTILGPPASPVPDRIISLMLLCGPDYPATPPRVKFQIGRAHV